MLQPKASSTWHLDARGRVWLSTQSSGAWARGGILLVLELMGKEGEQEVPGDTRGYKAAPFQRKACPAGPGPWYI